MDNVQCSAACVHIRLAAPPAAARTGYMGGTGGVSYQMKLISALARASSSSSREGEWTWRPS